MLQSEYYAKLEAARQRQDELYHHGIIGQKWGVRRFQEKDGSYTQAGRERYGYGPARESKKQEDTKTKSESKPKVQTQDKKEPEEKIGSLTALAALAGISVGTYAGVKIGDAIHNAKVTKDIKNWEANRQLEKTDPKTGLKLKSNPDASIEDDIKMINREYGYGLFTESVSGIQSEKKLGRTENCMLCTTALDLKRRGYDVKAGICPDGCYARDLKNWYKEKKDPTMGRFNSIVEQLNKQPDGSYGNFMVYWAEGGGHSMFYRVEDGKAVIYDAQSNKKYSMNEIAKHANMTLPGHCFLRTDNLTPNYDYLKKEGIIA